MPAAEDPGGRPEKASEEEDSGGEGCGERVSGQGAQEAQGGKALPRGTLCRELPVHAGESFADPALSGEDLLACSCCLSESQPWLLLKSTVVVSDF